MIVTYPALFYYDDTDGENVCPYFIHFPDFENSATEGDSVSDAMAMASEWLGMMVSYMMENGEEIPQPSNINRLSLVENDPFKNDDDFDLTFDPDKSFISMVAVDIDEYLGSQEPVSHTVTIPKWADRLASELHLDLSEVLKETILEKSYPDF